MSAPPSTSSYKVFACLGGENWQAPPLEEGFEEAYLSVGAIWRRDLPPNLRLWLARWWVLCFLRLRPFMPRVYTIWANSRAVHYSFLLPVVGRVAGMAWGDLEIGPCWTHPDYRRRGFFRRAIYSIRHHFEGRDRVFWMLTRHDNFASSSGILAAGFTQIGTATRRRHTVLPMHVYLDELAPDQLKLRGARDQLVEQSRYNARARGLGKSTANALVQTYGAEAIWEPLREPYVQYHRLVRREVFPGARVVDLCCGDGLHSLTAALAGAEAYAVDVAESSLELAQARARAHRTELLTICASAENLPFADATVDVVTCAGGLSYVDPALLMHQLQRVLKPGGRFIFVDSFDHNWIYRFNRFVHCLRRQRTLSTLRRMPDEQMLRRLRHDLGPVEVRYFGVLVFLVPILTRLFGETRTARFLTRTDRSLRRCEKLSFKVVAVVRKQGADGAQGA